MGNGVQTSFVDGLELFQLINFASECSREDFKIPQNYRNSVMIGGNCRRNPGVSESNCTVGGAGDWQVALSFSDNKPCGKLDSGKPSLETKKEYLSTVLK
jgi:hypothetical protein